MSSRKDSGGQGFLGIKAESSKEKKMGKRHTANKSAKLKGKKRQRAQWKK
jgi:hypothetical protein